jgi:hypothetical protein
MKKSESACVQQKRVAAERWYELVKDMTAEERLAFYEQLNQQFREHLRELQSGQPPRPAA